MNSNSRRESSILQELTSLIRKLNNEADGSLKKRKLETSSEILDTIDLTLGDNQAETKKQGVVIDLVSDDEETALDESKKGQDQESVDLTSDEDLDRTLTETSEDLQPPEKLTADGLGIDFPSKILDPKDPEVEPVGKLPQTSEPDTPSQAFNKTTKSYRTKRQNHSNDFTDSETSDEDSPHEENGDGPEAVPENLSDVISLIRNICVKNSVPETSEILEPPQKKLKSSAEALMPSSEASPESSSTEFPQKLRNSGENNKIDSLMEKLAALGNEETALDQYGDEKSKEYQKVYCELVQAKLNSRVQVQSVFENSPFEEFNDYINDMLSSAVVPTSKKIKNILTKLNDECNKVIKDRNKFDDIVDKACSFLVASRVPSRIQQFNEKLSFLAAFDVLDDPAESDPELARKLEANARRSCNQQP